MLDWQRDVQPVLARVYQLLDELGPHSQLDGRRVAAELGRDEDDPELGVILTQLAKADYISAQFAGTHLPVRIEPAHRGLQAMHRWPQEGQVDVDALLRLIDDQIADPNTPEEVKRPLRRIRDGIVQVGVSVFGRLLGAWAERVTGIGGPPAT